MPVVSLTKNHTAVCFTFYEAGQIMIILNNFKFTKKKIY